jgi:hypothetical protein
LSGAEWAIPPDVFSPPGTLRRHRKGFSATEVGGGTSALRFGSSRNIIHSSYLMIMML